MYNERIRIDNNKNSVTRKAEFKEHIQTKVTNLRRRLYMTNTKLI